MLVYPMSTGRNFDEVLRLLDSLQLTAKHTVATPVNWKPGQDVIIPTSVSDEDAKKKYPQGYKTLKPYLRVVSQPISNRFAFGQESNKRVLTAILPAHSPVPRNLAYSLPLLTMNTYIFTIDSRGLVALCCAPLAPA